MSQLILPRRKLLTGLAALFCAPAIVKASSLMAISPLPTQTMEIPFSDLLSGAGWEPINIAWRSIVEFDPATMRAVSMRMEPVK